MTVRCPTCDRPLDIPHHDSSDSEFDILQSLTSVSCPNCGLVSIDRTSAATVTYQQPRLDRTNTRIGHFVLIRRLGQGSFGEVWLANDVNLGRAVALKLPRSQGREMTGLMFEAKTAASLRHPNIVSIFEVGSEDEQVFIASEYIEGMTLRDFLTAGKPNVHRTIDLLMAIARALHYAHQQNIVHRDIKPANILLNKEGQPYITDFGIAKRINADATISTEGQVMGTARYMSPEQASGKTRETDRRSDIYALGVMMFEMLTRDVPFRGNVRAVLHQKIYEDAPSPRTLDRSLPKDLETICLKCLERDPAKRFASAQELAEELTRFSAGEPIRSRPISRTERLWRWCQRRPAIAGLLAGLFLSMSIGLLGVTFFWQRAEHSADLAEQSAAAARESLYRSWMNLASVHLSNGDNAGVKEMLARIADDPQMAGLRGFEWNYFDAVTAPLKLVATTGDVVRDVAVSLDGGLCASVGQSKEIHVWDARTGELVRALTIDAESSASIDFSPTSLHLASGSIDGYLRIWNPTQQTTPLQQILHGPPVYLVRYSPDGKRVLSAGKQGAIRVWEDATGENVAEVPSGKRSGIKDARFVDANTLLVATQDGHLRVWDLANLGTPPTPKFELDVSNSLESIALSDDGQVLLAGSYQGELTVMPLLGGPKRTHVSIWGRVDDIEFLVDSHVAVIVTSDGHTHFFDVDAGREFRGLNTHSLTFGSLARSANGKFLAIGSGDGSVTRIELDRLTTPAIMWHDSAVREMAFLPDGKRLVTACEKHGLRVWDIATGTSQPLDAESEHPGRRLSVQPDGTLVASVGGGQAVMVWDAATNKLAHELAVAPTGALAVVFSSSGKQLAVATRRGSVRAYETETWKPQFDGPEREGRANALAYSPDDHLLAVAWDDKSIELLDPATGQAKEPAIELKVEPVALKFCPKQGVLAIGTSVGEILLWDLAQRRQRESIKGHTARINALATLPDGRTLISGGRDRQLKLWDLDSGELITSLSGHLRQVFAIAVSPDGNAIGSGGLEGDVRIWAAR
jgi:WD40 repeat protein/serine/threonine protein kinase